MKQEWTGKATCPQSLPTLQDLYDMLERRICTLEVGTLGTAPASTTVTKQSSNTEPKLRFKQHVYAAVNKSQLCKICKEDHSIYKCSTFQSLSNEERLRLRKRHFAAKCSSGHCRSEGCNLMHHTMLHTALTIKKDPKEACLTSRRFHYFKSRKNHIHWHHIH